MGWVRWGRTGRAGQVQGHDNGNGGRKQGLVWLGGARERSQNRTKLTEWKTKWGKVGQGGGGAFGAFPSGREVIEEGAYL